MGWNLLRATVGIIMMVGLSIVFDHIKYSDYFESRGIERIGPEPIMPADEMLQMNPKPKHRALRKATGEEDGLQELALNGTNEAIIRSNEVSDELHAANGWRLQREYSKEWRASVNAEAERLKNITAVVFSIIGFGGFMLAATAARNIYRDKFSKKLSKLASTAIHLVNEAASFGSSIASGISRRKIKTYQDEHVLSQELLASGLITQEQFDEKHEELRRKIQEEQRRA